MSAPCAPRAHLRERGVTGRVEEGHQSSLPFYLIRADVLCDPARFASAATSV